MDLPFDRTQFLAVFAAYNTGVWPLQPVLLALAVGALASLQRRGSAAARPVAAVLAALWLWMALVYHATYFTRINPAAWVFAAVFALAGAGFAMAALTRGPGPEAEPAHGLRRATGWALVAYALVGYPLVALAAGQHWPALPTFGLPCPTTLFTVGVLCLAPRLPRMLALVPALWSLAGLSAATALGIVEDYGLVVSAAAGLAILLQPARRRLARA